MKYSFLLTILLTLISGLALAGFIYSNREMGLLSNTGTGTILTNTKKNKTVTLPYNNKKLSPEYASLVLQGGKNSGVLGDINTNKNGESDFQILVPKNDEEREEKIITAYKENIAKFDKDEAYTLYQMEYDKRLLTYLLDKKLSLGEVFQYERDEKRVVTIQDTSASDFFDSNISDFKLGETYTTDKTVPTTFYKFFNEDVEVETVMRMKLQNIYNRQGFKRAEGYAPIISIDKEKFQGDGILIKNYNKKQKEKITSIYNNVGEFLKSPKLVRQENDNKKLANGDLQSILDFTDLDIKKYYEFYIKGKNNAEILAEEDGKILIATDNAYILLYKDTEGIYPYDEEKLPIQGKNYEFRDVETIKVEGKQISEEAYKEVMSQIESDPALHAIHELGGITFQSFSMLYGNILED